MKFKKIKSLLILTLLFFTVLSNAQNGAVYSFIFNVKPELTDFVKVERKNRKWFSEYSESKEFSKEFIDSIKIKTEESLTSILQMPVKMCFHKDKSGKNIGGEGLIFGHLEGLPSNSFKRAKVDCIEYNRFIRFYVHIYNGGTTSVNFGKRKTKSKINPNLLISVVVFDENKKKVFKKKVVIKDFTKLRSVKRKYGVFDITKSEVLSSEDIYDIYTMGLEKLMKE